jgi:hypothetical protein
LPALRAGRNAAIVTGDRRWFAVAGTCDFAPRIRARHEITGLRPAGRGIARSRQIPKGEKISAAISEDSVI